jgi:hypothetical protein
MQRLMQGVVTRDLIMAQSESMQEIVEGQKAFNSKLEFSFPQESPHSVLSLFLFGTYLSILAGN